MTELEALLNQYKEDSSKLYREKTGIKSALSTSLGGDNEILRDPMHQEFYDNVQKQVEALAAEGDPEACTEAFRLLMAEKKKGNNLVQYNWLLAAETLAVPLVPFVPKEILQPICESYGSRIPKRDRLPKQEELYEAMCRQLGMPVKKKKRFPWR